MKTMSLEKFAIHLNKVTASYKLYETKATNFLGKTLEEEAKDKIGHLQQGGGPLESWKPLAESTKRDKERLGYVFNDEYNPLYRTGELQDSIGYVFDMIQRILYLGSTSEIMIYQELGTTRIPPRSVLGLTLFQSAILIQKVYSQMLLAWIMNKPLQLRKP